MTKSGTIASQYANLKECPQCGRRNDNKANYCDKCKYEFWKSEGRNIDDLTTKEIKDIKEFNSHKKVHKKFKNVNKLIADLND